MRKLVCVLGAVVGLAIAGPASAATFLFDPGDGSTSNASFFDFDITDQDGAFPTDPAITVRATGNSNVAFTVLRGSGGLAITNDGGVGDDEIDGVNGDSLTLTFNRRVRLENVVFAQVSGNDNVDFAINGRDVDVVASSASSVRSGLGNSDSLARFSDATFTTNPSGVIFTGSATPNEAAGRTFSFFTTEANDDFSLFAITVVTAVPVPATLPLMIMAIGGIGFAARRRQKQQAAA